MKPYYDHAGITIYHGDCLEFKELLSVVNIAVTDPPYGIGLRNGDVDGHRSKRDFYIANDDVQLIGQAILDWLGVCRIPTIAFASPWKPWRGDWRNLIAWDKGGAVGGGGDIETCLKRSWELIQIARNKPINGNRQESVVRYPMTPADTKLHIAAKPVPLVRWLIKTFAQPNDLIADPFMGSGTTLRAAKDLGRKAIGIEIEEKYCEIAARRMSQEVLTL